MRCLTSGVAVGDAQGEVVFIHSNGATQGPVPEGQVQLRRLQITQGK